MMHVRQCYPLTRVMRFSKGEKLLRDEQEKANLTLI